MLEYGVTNSPAYQALKGDSLKLLLEVWKRYRHMENNNGQISYSVREAAKALDCTANTAGKRFAELIELGFLAVGTKGAFSVKHKLATTWRLTLLATSTEPATRDYQKWRPQNATVSPSDTDSTVQKQNTVSNGDMHGITKRYRERQSERQKRLSVSPSDTDKAHRKPATVSPSDTHIHLATGSSNDPVADVLADIAIQVKAASA